ncbi:tripartite tricarboxylate transporter substrate-binding protein [Paraburkholderia tropica]|uniref:Bug family tripartite tricarboxylate transporter substrate binding protein n=1 Tax=Paraburkholderia tropica TaxID=92647 RepID=UPI0030199157
MSWSKCSCTVKVMVGVAIVFLWSIVSRGAFAEDSYPSRPVHIVVPYPPGGTTDYAARLIAQKLMALTGEGFVVDNKPGATGSIGAMHVLNAAHDGYTLLMDDTTFAILPNLFTELSWNPKTDFRSVSLVASTPVVLIVPKDSPYRTLEQLVDDVHARPSNFAYATGGYGGATQLAFAVFAQQAKLDMTPIPYKGAGESIIGMIRGDTIAMIAAVPSVISQLVAGKVRALAVSGASRITRLPDVPTFAEAGLPSYDVRYWFGLSAPAGTPDAVITKLNTLIGIAGQDVTLQAKLASVGASPEAPGPQRFDDLLSRELERWAAASRAAGIKPN